MFSASRYSRVTRQTVIPPGGTLPAPFPSLWPHLLAATFSPFHMTLGTLLLALLLGIISSAFSCTDDSSCTFAGRCVSGTHCECFPGYAGPTCAFFKNTTSIPLTSGFRLPDYHVWGSQVVYDPSDALYHMAASIYPADFPFLSSWLVTASIATATSKDPLGPYSLDVLGALPQGLEGQWDRNVMNPKLLRAPGGSGEGNNSSVWLLYYTGNSYDGPTPSVPGGVPLPKNQTGAQASQRLGLATAPHPSGPFTRLGPPQLSPNPNSSAWDARIISNVAVAPFGGNSTALLAIYKSSSPGGASTTQTRVCLGVAHTPHWGTPFTRLSPNPILPCPPHTFYTEDPTLWRDPGGVFHVVFKDFTGHFTGAGYSGAHATSADGGLTWALAQPPLAYTTVHTWEDGKVRVQHSQERVQVLLNDTDGHPLAVFFATDTELDGSHAGRTWNMAMPVR